MAPFFSTVIPSYNRAALLRTTLESVLAQSMNDQEVIVVDDGSTENNLDVLRTFGDRIIVLQQKNQGPGAARNLGARHARGEYIAFLDSDDLWFPWTLATYRQVIESQPNRPSIVAAVHHEFTDVAQLARIQPQAIDVASYPSFFASPRQWYVPSGLVLKREVMKSVGGFTEKIRICEDADFWLRIGTQPGFVEVRKPVCFGYREHPGSLSKAWGGRALGVHTLMNSEEGDEYPGGDQERDHRMAYITQHVRPISLGCLEHNLVGTGMKLYRRTFGWHLRHMRLRYLAAFPFLAAAASVRYALRRRRGGSP